MPDQIHNKRPHLILHDTARALPFTAHQPKGGKPKKIPDLPRLRHGRSLQAQLDALKPVAQAVAEQQERESLESGIGLQIQFMSQPDADLAFESLANSAKKIELLSVRKEGPYTFANVFVPEGKLAHF